MKLLFRKNYAPIFAKNIICSKNVVKSNFKKIEDFVLDTLK